MASGATLDDLARFKLALMDIIDKDMRRRFRTVEAAAAFAEVDCNRLSRLRGGQHDVFSVDWLFALVRKAGIRILINLEAPDLN